MTLDDSVLSSPWQNRHPVVRCLWCISPWCAWSCSRIMPSVDRMKIPSNYMGKKYVLPWLVTTKRLYQHMPAAILARQLIITVPLGCGRPVPGHWLAVLRQEDKLQKDSANGKVHPESESQEVQLRNRACDARAIQPGLSLETYNYIDILEESGRCLSFSILKERRCAKPVTKLAGGRAAEILHTGSCSNGTEQPECTRELLFFMFRILPCDPKRVGDWDSWDVLIVLVVASFCIFIRWRLIALHILAPYLEDWHLYHLSTKDPYHILPLHGIFVVSHIFI